ncbi:excalibur calcium-binding domain-containing protein [Mycolicibacterium cosmeticum]|uniref:excalibur calcium-binding domain-containing protein n=1 Tax=Mycolicibacterium cosmeticum TaxID=258533 RepID=UPI003204789E
MSLRMCFAAAGIILAGLILVPTAGADPYPNCTAAKKDNACNIPSSSDKYQPKLDRDGDGIGCEC